LYRCFSSSQKMTVMCLMRARSPSLRLAAHLPNLGTEWAATFTLKGRELYYREVVSARVCLLTRRRAGFLTISVVWKISTASVSVAWKTLAMSGGERTRS
jgi:hypothetical protein